MNNIYRERYFFKKISLFSYFTENVRIGLLQFFQNGHEAVENGLVDGLYPFNECKKDFFVAKQFSYPLPFPHQPHDAVPPAGGQQPVEEHHR